MARILMTGASGGIGTSLRKLLPPIYPDLVLSDIKPPADLGANEQFKAADLADLAAVRGDLRGRRRHPAFRRLFGRRAPGTRSCRPTSSAATICSRRRASKGVKRVIFASSNHAVGFYPRHHRIGTDVTAAPRQPLRRQQGVRRGGRRALCRQARTEGDVPAHRQFRRRRRSTTAGSRSGSSRKIWCSSAGSGSSIPTSISRSSTARPTMSAPGGTITAPTISATARPAAPKISASTRWPSRPSCQPDPVGDYLPGRRVLQHGVRRRQEPDHRLEEVISSRIGGAA